MAREKPSYESQLRMNQLVLGSLWMKRQIAGLDRAEAERLGLEHEDIEELGLIKKTSREQASPQDRP